MDAETKSFEDKVELLKKHDDHHWSIEAIEHNGNNYVLVCDGANQYVIEENDLHDVDELVSGDLDYHTWCSSIMAITDDRDLPDGFKENVPDRYISDHNGNLCHHGSI